MSLVSPAFSNAVVSFFPAEPTNGSPLTSSVLPGASPTNMTSAFLFPLPGTEFFLVLHKSHFLHPIISSLRSSSDSYILNMVN